MASNHLINERYGHLKVDFTEKVGTVIKDQSYGKDPLHTYDLWYPLGGRGHTGELLADETISAIAKAHGVSSAQVIIRWHLQRGIVAIPGSSNPDHILENISVFDFELTDQEMQAIAALDRNEKHDWY